mgnify:CR=1 FL=1
MKESKILKGVIATVAVFAFSVPAIASADELKGRTEKVTYADLDVQKEQGAEVLYMRLQQASKRVCGMESARTAGGVRVLSHKQECYRTTLDQAVAKIDNAALTSIHEG